MVDTKFIIHFSYIRPEGQLYLKRPYFFPLNKYRGKTSKPQSETEELLHSNPQKSSDSFAEISLIVILKCNHL